MISYRKAPHLAVVLLLTGCIQNNRIEKFDFDPVLKSKVISANTNELLKINICDEIPLK